MVIPLNSIPDWINWPVDHHGKDCTKSSAIAIKEIGLIGVSYRMDDFSRSLSLDELQ